MASRKVEPYKTAPDTKSHESSHVPNYSQGTSSNTFGTGKAIQVVKVSDEHLFELVEENLSSVLNREDVRHKKVVVVSVAGAFRKGKSFLLNFFIRYLNYIMSSEEFSDYGWLDDEDQPLGGFAWRGGAERETTGILMWSEPYCVTTPDGDELAVILLDTQGAFDTESTVRECATIFALSTMLSSVQVYNLHANIQENDLQHLQLFTEYGKLATIAGENGPPPFQSLLFLVRDWSYPYDYEYGMDGGNSLLAKRLELSASQHAELQLLRQQIRSCFETIDCFLMPHPGLKVATNPRFDGRLTDIESEFKEQLKDMVPYLLSRRHLVVKEISGNPVTGQDLIEYFKVYMKIFQGDSLPEPKSLMNATAEANNLVALTAAKSYYTNRMDVTCGGDRPYLHPEQLKEAHDTFMTQAMETFHGVKKMGGAEFSLSYMETLQRDINQAWEIYQQSNEAKSMLRTFRTPITFFICFIATYTLSGLFTVVGLSAIVSLLNALLLISLVLLLTWAYCRYTGELRDVGTKIDEIAQVIFDALLAGPIHKISDAGMQHMSNIPLGISTSSTAPVSSSGSLASSSTSVRRRNTPLTSTM
ncbi:atlastin-like [Watersipora subatra]|uniref:atlastin-like n=1 Tax=Watersipora subatra TaxID=2589382 RepID=UPI00355BFFE8